MMNIYASNYFSSMIHKFGINTLRSIRRFSSSTKAFSPFTEATFNDQIQNIKWSSVKSQQMNKFSFALNLKPQKENNTDTEWLKTADMQCLSTNLQFIWNMSHKYEKYLVDKNTYLNMLIQYYRKMETLKQNQNLNIKINPAINIKYLLPNFIYTDNILVLTMLKQKQLGLLETLFKQRPIQISEFIQLFATNIYNVTDWPFIYHYFYRYFYPNFDQLDSLKDIQMVFQYLSKFNQIQTIIIDRFFIITQKELGNQTLTLQNFLSICNCMGMILFSSKDTKLHKLIQKRQYNKLCQLSAIIFQKEVQFQQVKFTTQSILRMKTINQIMDLASHTVSEQINRYSNQEKQEEQMIPQIVKGIQTKQTSFLSSNQHLTIQSVKIGLIPKIVRGVLVGAYFCQNQLSNLNCKEFNQFILKYPCYPNLVKEFLLTSQSLHSIKKQQIELFPQIKTFQKRINELLNLKLKKESQQDILKKFYSTKQIFQRYHSYEAAWNLRGQSLITKLMLFNDYTFNNLLGMLKNDNNFLNSRFQSKTKQQYKRLMEAQKNIEKKKFDYWQYPQYFDSSFQVGGQSYKAITQDDLIPNYAIFYNQRPQVINLNHKNLSFKDKINYLVRKY